MSDLVKITVLKKMVLDDIVEKYAEKPIPACGKFEEGAVFITDGRKVPDASVHGPGQIYLRILFLSGTIWSASGPRGRNPR